MSRFQRKGVNLYENLENIHPTLQDWSLRWIQNHVDKFYLSEVNPYLLKYEGMLLSDRSCRVFLPLCGKSVDLTYLADKGHDVYGCEFVEKAVKDFFSEQSLEYTCEIVKDSSSGNITEYKAKSKRITIWRGDFFHLNSGVVGKFDAIWDRAAFEAINPSKRSEYISIMTKLMNENGRCLISTNCMTGMEYTGPPYNVTLEDIEKLFGDSFDIILLETTADKKFPKVSSKDRHTHFLKYRHQA